MSRLCKGYSVVIFCCVCPFLSVIITLEVITIERPKFSTGEHVPQYVNDLEREAKEKRIYRDFTVANLIISTIAATASVIAVIIQILSMK